MKINKIISLIIIVILFFSCTKKEQVKESIIKEKNLNLQVLEAYKEGKESLEGGDVLYAAKKFNEAEKLFPQSEWAPRSALMAAYSYYAQDYYNDAKAELERFIKIYPYHQNLDYAYYLIAIVYYEQIVDEKKDIEAIINAKKSFESVVEKFPNSDYAIDAKFKLDLIEDLLASKEMYIGRYYFEKKKWIGAINRFRTVVDEYETTIYVEEALHRLVEVHYTLGLKEEAQKYAQLLGYNYQSSQWYENSYAIFNKKYKKRKKTKLKKENKKTIFKKLKSLFD